MEKPDFVEWSNKYWPIDDNESMDEATSGAFIRSTYTRACEKIWNDHYLPLSTRAKALEEKAFIDEELISNHSLKCQSLTSRLENIHKELNDFISRMAEHLAVHPSDGYAHFVNAINGIKDARDNYKERLEESEKLLLQIRNSLCQPENFEDMKDPEIASFYTCVHSEIQKEINSFLQSK